MKGVGLGVSFCCFDTVDFVNCHPFVSAVSFESPFMVLASVK